MFTPYLLAVLLQESVRAIGRVKMMFFMPLLQCAAIVTFLVPWVIYSVYTASMADVSVLAVRNRPRVLGSCGFSFSCGACVGVFVGGGRWLCRLSMV